MSYDADNDCPNCGLSGIEPGEPDFPFCDRLCAVRFAERRALRKLRFDLFRWNVIEPIRCRILARWADTVRKLR